MLKTQHNAWIHAGATLVVCLAGVAVGITRVEWLGIIIAIVAVWTAEALNTALELLADAAAPEIDPLVAQAKDVAAGAVLISSLGALVIAVIVFGPRLREQLAL